MAAAPFKEQGDTSFNFGIRLLFFADNILQAFYIRATGVSARDYKKKNISVSLHKVERRPGPHAGKCVHTSPISRAAR